MAKTTGFEMNELLGVIATVSEVTQNSASTVGNSVKTLLSRMSNVKAGVQIDPDTGEALNDVEKVLNRVGIALRDNQGNWYDFYNVLDEVASRWDEFSGTQQSQITTALGGTRQRENVLVMLENWEKVKQYAETGANSAGTAMEKYGIVLESVEAKQAQLTAKSQEFYSNVLSDSIITGLLDIGNGLMDIVNIGDGAVGKILLLTTATLALSAVLSHLTDNGKKTFTELIAGFIGVSVAEGTATTGAGLLKVALDLLKSHPIILGLSILTTALIAGKAIFDAFNVTLEEQHEKAQQAKADYQEVANELKEVNSELQTTQQRIAELEGKDNLTFVEKEELENLKQTNAELEKRQYWLNLEAENKKKIANEEAKKAWDKEFNTSDETTYVRNQNGSATPKSITELELIDEQIKRYDELEKKRQELANKQGQWTKEEEAQFKGIIAEQEKLKSSLESVGQKIQTDFIDAYDVDDETKQTWIDLQDIIYAVLNPPTKESKLLEEIEKLPDYIEEALKQGGLDSIREAFADASGDINAEAYREFIAVLEEIGITADEAKDYLNSLNETADAINVTPLQSYAEIINNVKDKADALHTAQQEMSESGHLSANTVVELSNQFGNLDGHLIQTANGYAITKSSLDALNGSMLTQYETALTEAKKGALSVLDQEHKKQLSYNDTTESIRRQLVAQAQLAKAKYEELGIGMGGLSQYKPYTDLMDAIASIDNAQANYDKAKYTLNDITTNGTKNSKTQQTSGKEWWEESLDKLKDKLENNQITMKSYITSLESLRNKLTKGSDAWNKINKELQDATLDNLNNQFERGEITIDSYITGLNNLRKTYKENTEGYKELTQTINETKADKLADQYERGEIGLKKYAKELKNIRDTYKENSEEWKKYNDLIKDVKLDDNQSQYERGEITTKEYISNLEKLRKKYKENSEEYKKLTQTINETKADNLTDQYERGKISLDKYIEGLTALRDSYKKNSEEWKKYNDLIKQTKDDDEQAKLDKLGNQLDKINKQYQRGEITTKRYIEKLVALRNQYKKNSDEYKELNEQINDAKADRFSDQYERGKISIYKYITGLMELRESYKKNSEQWKKYNDLINEVSADAKQKKLDELNKQYENSEITLDQYISKLIQLRENYKENSDTYKELTKQINELEAEKYANQYENGTITLGAYIDKLTQLRDSYKKASEEWKKYNNLIKQTKLDALNKQYENSEITTEEYIKSLEKLRKEYNKNSEAYKELTKTINDTKAEQYADQYRRGEISLESYIKKLKELRDSYEKNTEEWKKYNDLINDTNLNAYAEQYENGEINADWYIMQLKQVQKLLNEESELYKEIGKIIEGVLIKETEEWIDELQKGVDEIEHSISLLGDINTAEEQIKYAELLCQNYELIQSNIYRIQKALEETNLTEAERVALQKELNDYLIQEVKIRDEIEQKVYDYYEGLKEKEEKEAELAKKKTLYDKEIELYGKDGKDLWEYNNNKKIDILQQQVDARNAEKEALDEINEREELQNNLLEAKLKLQNALNSKTTKILTKQEDGTWAYTFSANMAEVKTAQEEVDSAQKALDDYEWNQDTQKIQTQIDELNKNAETLAKEYSDTEFWANRTYEQTMNGIEKTYGDTDTLVEQWMKENNTNTSTLTSAFKDLTQESIDLDASIKNLDKSLQADYEAVNNNSQSISGNTQGVNSNTEAINNNTQGLDVKGNENTNNNNSTPVKLTFNESDGLAKIPLGLLNFAQQVVLSNTESTTPIQKLADSVVDLMDFTKFIVDNQGMPETLSLSSPEGQQLQTVIQSVTCNFPNINTTNGLQQAILDLPRVALQQK